MSTYCASRAPPSNCSFPPASMFAPENVESVTPLDTRTVIVAAPEPDTFSSQTVELDETTASCAVPETLRALAIHKIDGVPAALQLPDVVQLPVGDADAQLWLAVTGSLM